MLKDFDQLVKQDGILFLGGCVMDNCKSSMKNLQPALIHNPNSRKNIQDDGRFIRMARRKMGDFCVSTLNDSYLAGHLAELKKKGVNFIAIDGGDGTVSACLTAIANAYRGMPLPAVAVLPSGNTNLIAGDVGFGLRGELALDRIMNPASLRSSIRAPIKLSWIGKNCPPVLGMFGGCTGYARAVRIAHSPHVLRFAPHDLAVFFTIFSSLASLLFRRSRKSWMRGNELSWLSENDNGMKEEKRGRSFLYMATALEKLSYGIWPFWNAGSGRSGFHFLDVNACPKRLPSAFFYLLRGRVPGWLWSHEDYQSMVVKKMILETDSDFVLDGEVFPASGNEKIMLEEGPSFRFLHV